MPGPLREAGLRSALDHGNVGDTHSGNTQRHHRACRRGFLNGPRFQIRLGDRLVREGHKLRIYVPFGAYWYQYSLRRLQENPSIAGYIATDTFGRLLHRNGR